MEPSSHSGSSRLSRVGHSTPKSSASSQSSRRRHDQSLHSGKSDYTFQSSLHDISLSVSHGKREEEQQHCQSEKSDYTNAFPSSSHEVKSHKRQDGEPGCQSVKNDYTNNTFQGSSRQTTAHSPQIKESSTNLNETGESTRSLLSVLSHSSIGSLSSGTISDSSTTSSPTRTQSKPSKLEGAKDITNTQTVKETPDTEAALSPWEKWLIEKSKTERQKVRDEVRKTLVELKAKEEEEERNKERRRYIEGQVSEWLKQKVREEKTKRLKEERKKKREQKDLMLLKQNNSEKDKVKRQQWMSKKREQDQQEKEKVLHITQQEALQERMRKEKADEAFIKWKKRARHTPKPFTGSFYGEGHGNNYPVPGFINPNPWMPNENPPRPSTSRKTETKSSKKTLQSPPLLFKDRANTDKYQRWGRPR